ncbi:unnamed protein product [Rotaria sp. Silwood2]|nr:unnamed protein product [Rotaria sp. Silwood2]CAF2562887.1 unnamed protein product [Rotaria sp. Silwood2]CAF2967820.1 unnamed protein product [Rotaria sp. Silwood2]CAF3970748.1 unnamed protein product [Rotaria sp. Silwood2]CAF4107547.1 unnamed protein product [Rotaria sp. Silwood2]
MKTKTVPLKIILLLLTLYILQGVIIGFILAIPLYLDSRGAKWQEQGTFNFVVYPFSLKLAWAPIIDAVYISRLGRRKTWLIPIQFLLGIILFILSFYLTTLIEELKIKTLTCIFFFVYFLLASQDICVDGWALTLLINYNLQWASTCQTVGQTIGRFIGFTILMTFESANFTNRFIRKPFLLSEKPYGLFTIDQFIRLWAIAFLLVSFCIALFKKEIQETNHLSLCQTYFSIFKLFKKKCVRQLALLFLLSPIGYAATYAMTNLVLKKYGVPQETLGLLGIPLIFVKILIPFCITQTNRPLTWYNRSYLPRLLMCILIAIYIYFTPYILSEWYFYPILICLFILNESLIYLMLVSRVGFYARISDPSIGGTYITLLSMLGNLGASLTSSGILYTAGWIKSDKLAYPLLVGNCFLLGCLWLIVQYRTMLQLQALPVEKWHLLSITTVSNNINEELSERCFQEEERQNMMDDAICDQHME